MKSMRKIGSGALELQKFNSGKKSTVKVNGQPIQSKVNDDDVREMT